MLWDKRTFLFYLPSVFSKTYTLSRPNIPRIWEAHTAQMLSALGCIGAQQHWCKGLAISPLFLFPPELDVARGRPAIPVQQPKPSPPVGPAVTQISKALVKWFKSHHSVRVSLSFWQSAREVSIRWAIWLNDSSFVPRYTYSASI